MSDDPKDRSDRADTEATSKSTPYEVGYGKPPEHGKIKPGEVRNPRGRPKGSLNLKTELKQALAERVIMKVGGKPVRMSSQRAIVKSMVVNAIKGDPRAQAKAFDLMFRLFSDDPDTTAQKLSDGDQAILDAFLGQSMKDGRDDD